MKLERKWLFSIEIEFYYGTIPPDGIPKIDVWDHAVKRFLWCRWRWLTPGPLDHVGSTPGLSRWTTLDLTTTTEPGPELRSAPGRTDFDLYPITRNRTWTKPCFITSFDDRFVRNETDLLWPQLLWRLRSRRFMLNLERNRPHASPGSFL